MNVALPGAATIAAAFLLQLTVWRIRVPRRQTRALLAIFLGTMLAAVPGFLALRSAVPAAAAFLPAGIIGWAHYGLFVVSMTLAWMITFSAIDADSPSLHLILSVSDAGSDGISRERLAQLASDDILILPRVRDLVVDRMVTVQGDRYRITPKGLLMARIFSVQRRILGAGMGG